MAFHYFTIDKIRQIEIENIPESFYEYYHNLSEEMKAEIGEVRPDLVSRIALNSKSDERENEQNIELDLDMDYVIPEEDKDIEILEEQDEEGREIFDAWESISVRAWMQSSVQVPVLVCKVMPNHNKICRIHRIPLQEKTLKFKTGRGLYGIVGEFCTECMDFYIEDRKINEIAGALSERNIPTWIQPLEETLQEWKEAGKTIDIDNNTNIYIPDTWVEENPSCPIHPEEYFIEDIYRKVYKDRYVEFGACYCNKCKKIIMRNSKAQRLEEECGEIGIPPIHFERLRKENRKKIKPKQAKRKPHYFLQNGQLSTYSYGDDVDWIELALEDTIVISYSRACTEEHETEDVLGLVRVYEKKDGPRDYLILLGYCDECQQYYMDKDDYAILYKKGRPDVLIYDDTNSDYMVTSGAVFDSENEHLQRLENDLYSSIQVIRNRPDYVGKYATNRGGYDDGSLSFSKSSSEHYYKEIERLGNYIPKPYGYRTDLVDGDATVTYYLGPEDIVLDDQTRVISFNSDQGRTMVNYRTLEMDLGGKTYKVKRRRTFDIEAGKLFGYSEQSDEDAIFRSGITDRFLINVLNMRKRHHQLIDIISTIQENQNTIVDLPLRQNLIVQGCAGSGKTMVMLHRLSALKYNHPEFDFDGAVILTPNNNFNTHISGLASSLQLGYINRYSVEEYYKTILLRYDDSFKLQNKISDEANVNQVYVDYVYSKEFLQILGDSYKQKVSALRAYYDEVGMISTGMGRQRLQIQAVQDSELLQPLVNELSVIISDIKHRKEVMQQKMQKMVKLNERYEFLRGKIADSEESLQEALKTQTVLVYNKLQNAVEQRLEQMKLLDEDIARNEAEYQKVEGTLFIVRKAQKLAKLRSDIEKIQNQKRIYQEEIDALNGFMNTDAVSMSRDELLDFFQKMILYIADIQDNIRYIQRQEQIVVDYKKEWEGLPELRVNAQKELETVNQDNVEEELAAKANDLYTKLKEITPKSVYADIYAIASKRADDILKSRTGKSYIQSIRGTTYRFDLYLQLHFAMWYFGKTIGDNTFICVDEGQDLSITEYELIKALNRGKSIFNIYGDTNQLLKLGRGISDWTAVEKELEVPQIFYLNENYRNTNQITQFCNDTFEMQVLLTGVDGHKVKEIRRSRLEQSIAELKIGEERIAVILPRSVKKKEYIDQEQLPLAIREIMGDEMGNGKIAVVYVDEVKGVEFDRVFVVSDGMDKNEKYIAYTRALSNLTIVKDEVLQHKTEEIVREAESIIEIHEEPAAKQQYKNIKYGRVKKKKEMQEQIKIAYSGTCEQCGKKIELTEEEVNQFKRKGWSMPKICKSCKKAMKEPVEIAKCKKCGQSIILSRGQLQYLKKNHRMIQSYCSNCGKEVYETRICRICGEQFDITFREKSFYEFKNWQLPLKCGECRKNGLNVPKKQMDNGYTQMSFKMNDSLEISYEEESFVVNPKIELSKDQLTKNFDLRTDGGVSDITVNQQVDTESEQASAVKKNEPLIDMAVPFEGVREVSMSLIEIPDYFHKHRPGADKIEKMMEYYKENGRFDSPVQLLLSGNKYLLKDKFLRYHAAELLKLKKIEAVFVPDIKLDKSTIDNVESKEKMVMKRIAGSALKEGVYLKGQYSEAEIKEAIYSVFSDSAKKDTSYKFVFLKSIIDCMYDIDDRFRLSFDQLFYRFTEIYWPLVVGYDLQQKVGERSRSYLEQFLIKAANTYGMGVNSKFSDLTKKQQNEVVKAVKQKCKMNVVGALYGDTKGIFYSFSRKEEWIEINPLVFHFLMKYAEDIQEMNYKAWAEFMDKVNKLEVEEKVRRQYGKLTGTGSTFYHQILKSTFMVGLPLITMCGSIIGELLRAV